MYLYFFYAENSYCKIIIIYLYKAVTLSSKEVSSIDILFLRILEYNIIKVSETLASSISYHLLTTYSTYYCFNENYIEFEI